MFTTRFMTGLIVGAVLLIPNMSSPLIFSRGSEEPNVTSINQTGINQTGINQTGSRTVQISLDTDANVLIENSDGKRIGFDFTTKKFVGEIPDAHSMDRETSSIFILPYDKTGKPYKIAVSGRPASAPAATLSITGPGFIAGVRSLKLSVSQIQRIVIGGDGSSISYLASDNGATPQLFVTTQSGRDKPSYRFEVTSSFLSLGKTIKITLDLTSDMLYFNSDDEKKGSFEVMMRRTNPGGMRQVYSHQAVSFGRANNYVLDFAQWDGRGEACFHEKCPGCDESQCTKLKNEYLKPKE
jgi:hypothetical protein